MLSLDTLPPRGNYTLIILLKVPCCIRMPKHGWLMLDEGYYAYTGSALGRSSLTLKRRVARHLRKRKKKHWHIDRLLANKTARITAVVAAPTDDNKECEINRLIRNIKGATAPIMGFGASDCRHNCESHLIYLGENINVEKIADAYRRVVGVPQPQFYEP